MPGQTIETGQITPEGTHTDQGQAQGTIAAATIDPLAKLARLTRPPPSPRGAPDRPDLGAQQMTAAMLHWRAERRKCAPLGSPGAITERETDGTPSEARSPSMSGPVKSGSPRLSLQNAQSGTLPEPRETGHLQGSVNRLPRISPSPVIATGTYAHDWTPHRQQHPHLEAAARSWLSLGLEFAEGVGGLGERVGEGLVPVHVCATGAQFPRALIT
jgi:hypothetical protein